MYTQLNSSNKPESVTHTSAQTQTSLKRKRHHRTNSGSPRSSGCSKCSTARTSLVINAETQTDYLNGSDSDVSPSPNPSGHVFPADLHTNSQKVILHEFRGDDEGDNGNIVHLHYVAQQTEPGSYNNYLFRFMLLSCKFQH